MTDSVGDALTGATTDTIDVPTSDCYSERQIAAALRLLGRHKLAGLAEEADPETLAAVIAALIQRFVGQDICQCGHTRVEHESRHDAQNHCTHRCAPPWIPRANARGKV